MLKHKRIRERGKPGLSTIFKELHVGDKVAVIRNLSYPGSFPIRLQGRTGTITDKRGRAFVVTMFEGSKKKQFIINAVHLYKLK